MTMPAGGGSTRIRLGARGEDVAVSYLKKNGYKIVERNFRCVLGEIDIVAYDGKTLVFVEVRTRKSRQFGSPISSVSYRKQKKLISLANFYIKKHRLFDKPARFDVVGITLGEKDNCTVELVKNAFSDFTSQGYQCRGY